MEKEPDAQPGTSGSKPEAQPGTSGTSGSLTGEGLLVLVQSLVGKALEAERAQPGTSDTSGSLMGKGLKVLVQSLVEKALEAERARSLSAGLTSSGEYTFYLKKKKNLPNSIGMTSLGSIDVIVENSVCILY